MTAILIQRQTKPCSLCCGLINYVTHNLDEEPTEAASNQPPWHETSHQVQHSAKSCPLCEAVLQMIILPRLERMRQTYPDVAALLVSLKIGSHSKVNGVHWANFQTSLSAEKENSWLKETDSIGIWLQSQGSTTKRIKLISGTNSM